MKQQKKKCRKHLFSQSEANQLEAFIRSSDYESRKLGLDLIKNSKTYRHYMGTKACSYRNALKCLRTLTRV